jgi:ribulose-phosphate 3-epimerase
MEFRIAPSLASAPLSRLDSVVAELEASRVDFVHFDIEDGSFVPCMTLGTKLIGDLRPLTKIPFDVHLMMVNPEWLLPELARLGANRVSVHLEACKYPRRVLRQITTLGLTAGLALNPKTPVPDLAFLAPYLSFVVVLTTEPEVPDAPYLPEILQKLRRARDNVAIQDLEWVVDGGVRAPNVREIRQAGADTVVVGRGIFNDAPIDANVRALRTAANG